MSRLCLGFLRPYLCPAAWPRKPEHANAYLSVQRRLATTVAAEDYIGPHDVEKQKRIEQLKRVRPLDAYHPSLSHAAGVERLSLRDFNVKYHSIQETQNEVVSVLGMPRVLVCGLCESDMARKGALRARAGLQATVPRY